MPNPTSSRKVLRNYKFRIYPNKTQARTLSSWLETSRHIYNAALAQRKDAWEKESRSVSRVEQQVWLKDAKTTNGFFKELHSQPAQEVLFRLERAFSAFFRRAASGGKPGYPRFKGRGYYKSITFTQSGDGKGACFLNGKLKLSKVGLLKIVLHRAIPGSIKTVTVKREACGKWFAVFSVELEVAIPPRHNGPQVGLDVGIREFAVLSDGRKIENPKHFRKSGRKLKTSQRDLSRKKKGSNSRAKARVVLARRHEKVRNQRRDFHHKVSTSLVKEYSLIAVEDLEIGNMVKNHNLAKSIADAGWGEFLAMLGCKAESAGSEVRKVAPQGTSQQCSRCGEIVRKDLAQRTHLCPCCGLVMDRDQNAAVNILRKAV